MRATTDTAGRAYQERSAVWEEPSAGPPGHAPVWRCSLAGHVPRRQEVEMRLSREEQRVLDEIEAVLCAEDPDLEANLRTSGRDPVRQARLVCAATVFVVGLALLVAGVSVGVAASVAGFLLMVTAALVGVSARPGAHFGQPPPGP